jgi:hypothetical protein
MVSVRFPTGEREFRMTAEAPKVGDTLKRGDDEWPVSDVRADEYGRAVLTLGSMEPRTTEELGASGAGVPLGPHA